MKGVFGMLALLLGMATNAIALSCGTKIHVQKPADWDSLFVITAGSVTFIPESLYVNGWYAFDAEKYGYSFSSEFILGKSSYYYLSNRIDSKLYNSTEGSTGISDEISCAEASELYIYENPKEAGKTVVAAEPPGASYLYFLPPDNAKWNASSPMISTDGGKTGVAMMADPDRCGWFYSVWFNEKVPSEVVFFRASDAKREEVIGGEGYEAAGSKPDALLLSDAFEMLNTKKLFYVPDASVLTTETSSAIGLFTEDPSVTGTCSYSLATVIYDTDASLHPAFSCYAAGGEGCQFGAQGISATQAVKAVNACIGVTHGIVQDTLGKDNKPILSEAGKKCFLADSLFNQLFRPTEGVNEMSCFNVPFTRASDGRWEFNSDYYQSKGVEAIGGFYPVETTTDEDILTKYGSTPVAAARTKRIADGPVFVGPLLREVDSVEGMQKFDLLCNSSSWDGGLDDCAGRFADGDETAIAEWLGIAASSAFCLWGWSCQESKPAGWPTYKYGTEKSGTDAIRWNDERNQHFCFESHSQFTYQKGMQFNFRGDDDIWVFIGGKLAVDIGGAHLAAPGYAKLDKLTDKNGSALVEGQTYPLDIFFCDRRTTMSNVRISTNMFLQQGAGLTVEDGELCYSGSMGGNCEATLSGASGVETYCGSDLMALGITVSYNMYKNGKIFSADGVTYDSVYFKNAGPNVFFSGIVDLTDWYKPVVQKTPKEGLSSGYYKLVASVNGKKTFWTIHVPSSGGIHSASTHLLQTAVFAEGKVIRIQAPAKTAFSVLDVQGRVLQKGIVNGSDALIKMPKAGAYLVRAQSKIFRVNVR